MNETTQPGPAEFIIGAEVTGQDGALGTLYRVVINPVTTTITHLVVEPRHRLGAGHLVPVDLVVSATATEITLSAGSAAFTALDQAEDIHFVPGGIAGPWNYQQSQMLTLPYYPLGGAMGMGMGMNTGPQPVITDRVPAGDVEVRRGDPVHASDGDIGRVQGLVVNPQDHSVSHVLLDEGHLWGKKRVAIPISAVTRVDDGVQVSLTKRAIEDLPPVDLDDLSATSSAD